MRWLALTVDVLLLPLRVICWPFLVLDRQIGKANKWIRRNWRREVEQ